jgi:hypothetical protein
MRIAVFCSGAATVDPRFLVAARVTGQLIGQRGHQLVYGGAPTGLQAAVADGAHESKTEVVAVMAQKELARQAPPTRVDRLEVLPTLAQRKARMLELCDAVAFLPGGVETLDDAFDLLNRRLWGEVQRRVAFLDTLDHWKPLQAMLGGLAQQRFITPADLATLGFCPTPLNLLERLERPDESAYTTLPGM